MDTRRDRRPPRRKTAQRFAVGVTACQIGWLSLLLAPQLWPLAWALHARVLRGVYHQRVAPVAVVLVVGAIFTPAPVLVIGLVLAGVVVAKIVFELR
ncbi:MAG TPA: hypothetical protein VK915_03635 [Gaiellaceae bacterium]|nr:hypothetical protein [Gaiellaceae bacterium]